MRNLVYYLRLCSELDLVLNIIAETIPCFAQWNLLEPEDDYIMVNIDCRQEDATYVEKMLAPFV